MSKPWEIPANWRWSTMGEVADIVGGGTPKSDQSEYFGGDIPWITPADLSGYTEKFISTGSRNITEAGLDNSGARVMPAGVVLFSSRAPIGYVAIASNPVSTNQGFKSFILREGLTSDFVYYYLQHAKPLAVALASGTTFLEISGKKAAQIPIPVPPLPDQHRIVTEIELQFTRFDVGVAALRRVQANLKRYRAAVLKAACEGRLVTTDLRSWRKLKVSEIGKAVTGNTPPTDNPENLGNELPFFKPTDLDAGYNVRAARQYLSIKGAVYARVLPAGSILVTCIGATIGKTGFARVPCATNQQINALVVDSKIATPEWMFCALTSPVGQQQIKSNASATTLPILNKSKFEALSFLTPPLAEQTRIVAEVERRLSVVDELESVVAANMQRATRLRQSILQCAFTGNLVPQNPSDESAEMLLKRINDLPTEAPPVKRQTKSKDQNIMLSKPVTSLEEMLQRLDSIGGTAAPDRLLAVTGLGEEVESFFDFLREGRNKGVLIVPTGTSGDIKRINHEN